MSRLLLIDSQIVVLMALLSQMLTWQSALAGLGVTLAILPLSLLVTRWQSTTRQNGLEHTDARVKLTGEVLTGRGQAMQHSVSIHCLCVEACCRQRPIDTGVISQLTRVSYCHQPVHRNGN